MDIPSPPKDHTSGNTDHADPASPRVTLKTFLEPVLRLIEIQLQIIGLRLVATVSEMLQAAILLLCVVLLLIVGITFFYFAAFKALLLVMGSIEVCLIFAGVHIGAALIILVLLRKRNNAPHPQPAGTNTPREAAHED